MSLNAEYTEFSIKTVGRFVRLETKFGLVVQYDGYNMMFVQIPDAYAGKLGGICNNMDGDVSNDLRDCTGIQRSDDAAGHTLYGDSCQDSTYVCLHDTGLSSFSYAALKFETLKSVS